MTPAELREGDLIEFVWYDIFIDETGNPADARLMKRRQYGLFVRLFTDDSGIETMVTSSGVDEDEEAGAQNGWQAVPVSLVREIKRIRKGGKRGGGDTGSRKSGRQGHPREGTSPGEPTAGKPAGEVAGAGEAGPAA